MFSCPNCSADRSRVLPVDPCPTCGALLVVPKTDPPSKTGSGFTQLEDEIKTVVADDGHAEATVAAQNHSDRAVTVSGDVALSFDGSQTVAFEDEFSETAAEAPRPPTESLEEFEVVTDVSEQPDSPFDSQDELSERQHDVMTKTVIEEEARSLRGQKRAPSPDVLSRTIVEAAAKSDSSTPPLTSAVATPAGGRPSDVLPRPPKSARSTPPRSSLPGMSSGAGTPSAPALVGMTMPSPAEVVANSLAAGFTPSVAMAGASPLTPPVAANSLLPPVAANSLLPPVAANSLLPPVAANSHPPVPGHAPSAIPMSADPAMQMPADYALPHAGLPPVGPPPDLQELPEQRIPVPTPANAVWRAAHPSAQEWASKRQGQAVRTPKLGVIALGLMLIGLGGYLLAIFLPSKAPLTAYQLQQLASQAGVDEKAWRFTEDLLGAANLNAALFIVLGLVLVLRGAFYQQQPVVQRLSKPALMLAVCFVVLAASFGALILSSTS